MASIAAFEGFDNKQTPKAAQCGKKRGDISAVFNRKCRQSVDCGSS